MRGGGLVPGPLGWLDRSHRRTGRCCICPRPWRDAKGAGGMLRACRILRLLVWAGSAPIAAAADSAPYTFRGFRLGMPLAEAQQPFAALKCESRHTLDDGKTLVCIGVRDPATLAATDG